MRHDFPLAHSSLMTAWLRLAVLVLLLIYTSVRRDSGLLATCPSWSENTLQLSSEQQRMSIYLISTYEQILSTIPRRSSTVDKGHQLDCWEAPTKFEEYIFFHCPTSFPAVWKEAGSPSPLLLLKITFAENPCWGPWSVGGRGCQTSLSGRSGPRARSRPYAVLCLNHKTVLSPL